MLRCFLGQEWTQELLHGVEEAKRKRRFFTSCVIVLAESPDGEAIGNRP